MARTSVGPFHAGMTDSHRTGERRGAGRRRIRLHAGRLFDLTGRFLCEARLGDRSAQGVGMTLSRDCALPAAFLVFDEASRSAAAAQLIWAKGREAGAALGPWRGLDELEAALRQRLAGDYYARDPG